MRDAFGGAFSIKLALFFLMLYVAFMCVAINYARAFRVKNQIINMIEQNEGYDNELDGKIVEYLQGTGYSVITTNKISPELETLAAKKCTSNDGKLKAPGYCIAEKSTDPRYYLVETYLLFELPIIGIDFPIAVRGETRRIEVPIGNY